MDNVISRRKFLAALGATAATAPTIGFPAIVRRRGLNEMLSHACVGVNHMASNDLRDLSSHRDLHITALCDVDANYVAAAKRRFPDARVYRNALEMLAAEGDRIDSVNVSTPDHTHAQYVIDALRRGKNVYSQKPLCTKISDGREIMRLAQEKKAVTQLGTQIAAWECDRQSAAVISSGMIGEVRHVWIFSHKRSEPKPSKFEFPLKETPVPEELDWKTWLGPAPYRPYSKDAFHPANWRKWRDFGSGMLGDMGIHMICPVWLGLGLGTAGALTVRAEVADIGWNDVQKAQFWPELAHVTWGMPACKASGGKPFEIEWCSGYKDAEYKYEPKHYAPASLQDIAALTPLGVLPTQGRVVEGTKGWLISTHWNKTPCVVTRRKQVVGLGQQGGDSLNVDMPGSGPHTTHYHEYVDACLQGGKTTCPFSVSAKMSEWVVTGNLASLDPDKTHNVEDLLKKELA